MMLVTSAGDVDGPLKVLLPDDNACCSALFLRVPLDLPLHPHSWRDEVALLGPGRQEERSWLPHIQRHLCVLRQQQQLSM